MPFLIFKYCCKRHVVPFVRRTYCRVSIGKVKFSIFSSSTTAAGVIVGLSTMANVTCQVPRGTVNSPDIEVPPYQIGKDGGVTSSQTGRRDKENELAFVDMKRWAWLSERSPGFAVKGSSIRVITCPNVFYETLLEKVGKAEKRISLASLYLGNGKMEDDLVSWQVKY